MTAISTTLRDASFVLCSAADTHRHLLAHFAGRHGVTPAVLVRVPLADLALDHPVIISLADLPTKPGEYLMEVSWAPEGGGPYPTFIGSLAIFPDGSETSHLELEGAYTIPGGIIGKAFDATIGHRIAEAGANSVLLALRGIVETAHQAESAARPAVVAAAYPPTYE